MGDQTSCDRLALIVMGLTCHPGMGPSVGGKKFQRGLRASAAARAILCRHIVNRRQLSRLGRWRKRRRRRCWRRRRRRNDGRRRLRRRGGRSRGRVGRRHEIHDAGQRRRRGAVWPPEHLRHELIHVTRHRGNKGLSRERSAESTRDRRGKRQTTELWRRAFQAPEVTRVGRRILQRSGCLQRPGILQGPSSLQRTRALQRTCSLQRPCPLQGPRALERPGTLQRTCSLKRPLLSLLRVARSVHRRRPNLKRRRPLKGTTCLEGAVARERICTLLRAATHLRPARLPLRQLGISRLRLGELRRGRQCLRQLRTTLPISSGRREEDRQRNKTLRLECNFKHDTQPDRAVISRYDHLEGALYSAWSESLRPNRPHPSLVCKVQICTQKAKTSPGLQACTNVLA